MAATVIPGEASETDDDDDDDDNDDNDFNGSKNCQQPDANEQNNKETRNWNLNDAQQRSPWSLHVDEKLEERWRLLGSDTVKLAQQQAFLQRKQYDNLKQNLSNMQHSLQAISSTFRQAGENLARVEWNLSLLQEGAKLIPDFSTFPIISDSSKE